MHYTKVTACAGQRIQPVRGMGGRALPAGVPDQQRRSETARVRLGDAQHQQPQRAHTEEVVPRRARLLQTMRAAQRRVRPLEAGHMRQGQKETTRYGIRHPVPSTHLT